jgi:hypothetical protein
MIKDFLTLKEKSLDYYIKVKAIRERILKFRESTYLACFVGNATEKSKVPTNKLKDKDKLRIWLR